MSRGPRGYVPTSCTVHRLEIAHAAVEAALVEEAGAVRKFVAKA